jgi:hypothetical protein
VIGVLVRRDHEVEHAAALLRDVLRDRRHDELGILRAVHDAEVDQHVELLAIGLPETQQVAVAEPVAVGTDADARLRARGLRRGLLRRGLLCRLLHGGALGGHRVLLSR